MNISEKMKQVNWLQNQIALLSNYPNKDKAVLWQWMMIEDVKRIQGELAEYVAHVEVEVVDYAA